jgi:hypothetical protein
LDSLTPKRVCGRQKIFLALFGKWLYNGLWGATVHNDLSIQGLVKCRPEIKIFYSGGIYGGKN